MRKANYVFNVDFSNNRPAKVCKKNISFPSHGKTYLFVPRNGQRRA